MGVRDVLEQFVGVEDGMLLYYGINIYEPRRTTISEVSEDCFMYEVPHRLHGSFSRVYVPFSRIQLLDVFVWESDSRQTGVSVHLADWDAYGPPELFTDPEIYGPLEEQEE